MNNFQKILFALYCLYMLFIELYVAALFLSDDDNKNKNNNKEILIHKN